MMMMEVKKEANITDEDDNIIIRYSVTGRAAHERVGRLLRRVVVDEEEAVNEVEGSTVDNDRGGRQSSVAVTSTKRWIDLSPYATHADNRTKLLATTSSLLRSALLSSFDQDGEEGQEKVKAEAVDG